MPEVSWGFVPGPLGPFPRGGTGLGSVVLPFPGDQQIEGPQEGTGAAPNLLFASNQDLCGRDRDPALVGLGDWLLLTRY